MIEKPALVSHDLNGHIWHSGNVRYQIQALLPHHWQHRILIHEHCYFQAALFNDHVDQLLEDGIEVCSALEIELFEAGFFKRVGMLTKLEIPECVVDRLGAAQSKQKLADIEQGFKLPES